MPPKTVSAVGPGAGAGAGGGEEPGGGDVGAELAQGPGLGRALERAGGRGGPLPDPGGGVGREVGREPGHAVPVRGVLDPPVRGASAVALFDAGQVVAFAPGAGLGPEPGRHEVPGRAPAGGVRGVRVQEVPLQPGRPGGVQAGGFIDDDPGVLPGDRPGLQRRQGQRQARGQRLALGQQGAGGAFADGQDTGDLGDQGHLPGGVFLRGRRRRRQRPGRPRVVGGQPHLQRSDRGFHPGDPGEPVQARIRQIPQRISTLSRLVSGSGSAPVRDSAGRIRAVRPCAGGGQKHSNGRGHGLQGRPAVRTPASRSSPHACFRSSIPNSNRSRHRQLLAACLVHRHWHWHWHWPAAPWG